MSFISTGVEYGLHCLLYLTAPASHAPAPSVRDLADLQGVPAEYLAKLFTKLSRAGLVMATEGARGGFALARPADEISFLDVVEAIDGDKKLFECREIRERCAVFNSEAPAWATTGVCSIHLIMRTAEKRMRDELANHSLGELAMQVAAKAPGNFTHQIATWLDERTLGRRGDRDTASADSAAATSPPNRIT
ncbi:MAG TPA: Rrf2 family transcriptional regulator [Telmatospirillum sp.]|nr:Rrf2 family transcriptional regulator [Telmatospirillum sp.]